MLRFGTSGIPLSTRRPGTEHGIRRARELGLDCLEMAWVNGIRMSDATADRIAGAARECDLELTAHAPYYVNLCGAPDVVERSRERLVQAGRLAARCGAASFCFHAGFYQKLEVDDARARVRGELEQIADRLREMRAAVDIRPELTGRSSQLGTLEEVLDWCVAVAGVSPCVDFSHLYARSLGAHNRYQAFAATLERIGERLGPAALERLHVHISGIEFGPAGERRHLPLRKSKFRFRELLRALRDFKVSGWAVCESPEMEQDALLLQRTYRRLQ